MQIMQGLGINSRWNSWVAASAALLLLPACGGDIPEEGQGGGPTGGSEVGETGESLLGTVGTSGCLSSEQSLAINAVNMGRFIAVSNAFRTCVSAAVNGTTTGRHDGAPTTIGPYIPQGGDPFATLTASSQIINAAYAGRSTSDVSIACSNLGAGVLAEAVVGSWQNNRQASEALSTGTGWRTLVNLDNGGISSTADYFQASRGRAANSIWHEAMHQWGYRHRAGGFGNDLLATMPYIVGDCIERIAFQSASCVTACGANRRPVGSSCTCIDDPQFDVGIIPEQPGTAATCPTISGRGAPGQDALLTISMDDEDDGNENSAAGWIGGFSSGKNTTFRFCRAAGVNFHATRQNYGVLRMGAACPPGAVPFARGFDNEDDGNINGSTGHVPPNTVNTNTTLQFCTFLAGGTTVAFPSLAVGYGVFGPTNLAGALATGSIHTDDEDDNNANSTGGVLTGSSSYISADRNTTLLTVKVR